MQYRDCGAAGQAAERPADKVARAAQRLAEANINPATGLATDYLNRFNEAIMLLEMLSSCPECLDDFLGWRPASYREHFQASHFKCRDLAIAAYEGADPQVRDCLDTIAETMTGVLEATRAMMEADLPPETAGPLAERAADFLKVLVARAGAVINGEVDAGFPADLPDARQATIDGLMSRSI